MGRRNQPLLPCQHASFPFPHSCRGSWPLPVTIPLLPFLWTHRRSQCTNRMNPSTEELTQQTFDTGVPIELHAANLRECLRSYQRAIIWSLTAAFMFLLLSLSLGEKKMVPLLWGEVSSPVAWFLAMLAFFLFGGYANSCLNRGTKILKQVGDGHRKVLILYPSLATSDSVILRLGSVVTSLVLFVVGFALQLKREWGGLQPPNDINVWSGLALFMLAIWAIYGFLIYRLRRPYGSDTLNP